MAHEKFYGICENKCRVDITNKVVKARNEFTIEQLYSGQTANITFPYYIELGYSNEEKKLLKDVAIISLTKTFYTTSSGGALEFNHFVNNGSVIIQVFNKSSYTISDIHFIVAVI